MTARLTARDRLLRGILEATWQQQVIGLARYGGWEHYHPPDNSPRTSKRSGARYVQNTRRGFPDLIMVKGDRLLAVELKTETGVVTDDQVRWLLALQAAGAEVDVWRPRHSEIAEAVLVRGALLPPWLP